jgi:uncharacterized protein (TIGR00730 family)
MTMSGSRISVFGGSTPRPGEDAYQDALHLGRLLGAAGHVVLTGGYIGTMEAVSRGAADRGGHVIGVTCDEIESWRPVAPNQWIREERRFETLRERLFSLIESCDAALALPGGLGTLTEIALMWTLMQTNALPAKPLILIGPGWRSTFDRFFQSLGGYVSTPDRDRLTFSPDVAAAFLALNQALGEQTT